MTDAQILQFIGILYVSMGLSMLMDANYMKALFLDFFARPATMWLAMILAVLAGFMVVSTRTGGEEGWHLFVVVVGWLALIKGMFGLVFPKSFHAVVERMMDSKGFMQLTQWIVLLGGGLLLYVGFAVI